MMNLPANPFLFGETAFNRIWAVRGDALWSIYSLNQRWQAYGGPTLAECKAKFDNRDAYYGVLDRDQGGAR